jgi:hypothetical protein
MIGPGGLLLVVPASICYPSKFTEKKPLSNRLDQNRVAFFVLKQAPS